MKRLIASVLILVSFLSHEMQTEHEKLLHTHDEPCLAYDCMVVVCRNENKCPKKIVG